MTNSRLAMVLVIIYFTGGCVPDPKSSQVFTLPDGDATHGEVLFTQFQCYECHSVSGVTTPASLKPEQSVVRLGGEVARIKTYGELVTSIINPSHRLASSYAAEMVTNEEGESQMRNYNDVMTVSELIDLVAFLQTHYSLRQYEPTTYDTYHFP